ncbi:MAG: DUF4340 domain-containing protein, partial [Alphaproteobacteria bacterium]
ASGVVTVGRKDKLWTVNEASGYPARMDKIGEILNGLAQLETIEAKTSVAKRYGKLEVGEPTAKGTKSARVVVSDAQGTTLADLIVGKIKYSISGADGIYVRRPGEERAWLVRGKLEVPQDRLGWVDQSVMEIDLDRVRSVVLRVPGNKALTLFKDKRSQQDFKIKNMPKGTEIKDVFTVEDIARILQSLTFADVRRADKVKIDMAALPRAHYLTFDGLQLDLWVAEADGKTWLAAKAAAMKKPAPDAKVKKEIAAINARFADWRFALPDYEFTSLKHTLKELVKPKKAKKPKGAQAATPAKKPGK